LNVKKQNKTKTNIVMYVPQLCMNTLNDEHILFGNAHVRTIIYRGLFI